MDKVFSFLRFAAKVALAYMLVQLVADAVGIGGLLNFPLQVLNGSRAINGQPKTAAS